VFVPPVPGHVAVVVVCAGHVPQLVQLPEPAAANWPAEQGAQLPAPAAA